MAVDIVAIAESRGWRTRNLHDGFPCPPIRRRGERRSDGYFGPTDRADAIICRYGTIEADGDRLLWTLLPKSGIRREKVLRALAVVGLRPKRLGDHEAWGFCGSDALDAVAAALSPWPYRVVQKKKAAT